MHHCVHIEPEFEEILAKLKEWFVSRVNKQTLIQLQIGSMY